MHCKDVRTHFLDLAAGAGPADDSLAAHLRLCAACERELESLRSTMAVLDEWQAPADVSPYFMTRLRARMHDEEAPASGWLLWVRKPVLAAAMTMVMIAAGGVSLLRVGAPDISQADMPRVGSAVADLQYLDKNNDLLADFELLDEVDIHNR